MEVVVYVEKVTCRCRCSGLGGACPCPCSMAFESEDGMEGAVAKLAWLVVEIDSPRPLTDSLSGHDTCLLRIPV